MEDIALLKKLVFFSKLNIMDLSKINVITHRAAFKAGEVIIEEGTPGTSMYLLKSGSAIVTRSDKVIARLVEGDPIGEIAFIDKGPRSATVKAEEDAVLIDIPGDEFEKLLEQHKDIALKVYKAITETLCQRLRDANQGIPLDG